MWDESDFDDDRASIEDDIDDRIWTTRDGIRIHFTDMSTSHLINTVAMIARTKKKREHGIVDPYELNGLTDDQLDGFFGTMMEELNRRLKRKRR
jgi:hypothetical protein